MNQLDKPELTLHLPVQQDMTKEQLAAAAQVLNSARQAALAQMQALADLDALTSLQIQKRVFASICKARTLSGFQT